MSQIRSRIVCFGTYLPSRVVTNKELETYMDTSDEWIEQRSGIRERRWVTESDTTCSMAVAASKAALDKAGLKADDIDCIVFGALITDYVFPGTGVLLQRELGFTRTVPALDIRNQCSGFIYGLSVADAWIRSGMYKRILLVGSEIHSNALDISTRGRDISVLFGDGAGACIIEACTEKDSHIMDTVLHSEGLHAEKLTLTKPSANDHPRLKLFANNELGADFAPYMDGKLIFKNAVTRMTEVLHEITKKNKIDFSDIDMVIPHQANLRINTMILQGLKIPLEKSHHTIQKYGNTTMATIPITMSEAIDEGKIKRGDLVCLVAFGAGFTWGSTLLRF